MPNSINEQKSIAHILGTLDDKIELNRQMNKTLEEMAQALFKSWFVDFDPVHAKAEVIAKGGSEEDARLAAMAVISGKVVGELSPETYPELAEIADEFPSEFVESALGLIPEGWEVVELEDLIEFVVDNRGKTPPTVDNKKGYPLIEVNALKGNKRFFEKNSIRKFVEKKDVSRVV